MNTRPTIAALRIDFHDTRLDLEVEHGADIDMALEFLATHLIAEEVKADDGDRQPAATLRIHASDSKLLSPPAGAVPEAIYVRKSASEFFTVPARRSTVDGREYLECVKTGSRFTFDRAARVIDVHLGAEGYMDLVELVRDLVLKHQENAGATVLHAAAAYRDGTAVLITGGKGAGKSTLLLELVEHFGYQVLSGDKTLLHELPDGSLVAAGWPDYPHLGYDTIAKYHGLKEIAGIGDDYTPAEGHAFSPLGKFAVDSFRFRERFPSAPAGVRVPVAAILYPAIGAGDRTVVELLPEDRTGRAEVLRANVESAFDGANAGWHHYLDDGRADHADQVDRVLATLAEAPAWTITGPGDLTTENLPLAIGVPTEAIR